jgi:hypothetical protein
VKFTRLTLAAALVAATFAANDASAQSDRRIPTRKGEEPLPTRTDTLIVRDTVRITDTVTVSRVDTVVRGGDVALPAVVTPLGRFYWGLDGGAAIPTSEMNISQNPGYTVGALLGWDAAQLPLGLRLDGGYTRFDDEDDFLCTGAGCSALDVNTPELWHASFDLKLRLPTTGTHLYGVGGVTWNRFRGVNFIDDTNNNELVFSSNDWTSKWGGNIGGGVNFGFGGANLFIESRVQAMTIANQTQTYVPIILGFTF